MAIGTPPSVSYCCRDDYHSDDPLWIGRVGKHINLDSLDCYFHKTTFTHRSSVKSFKSFITIKMKHLILFLGVLFAVCVFWSDGYSREEVFKQWNCISESGDEHLCNEFQDCFTLAPKCYLLPYSYCMRNILPNGPGHCSKTEQAYGSEKQRIEVANCYSDITILPNGDDWTSIPELAPFLDCVQYLGYKCKYRERSESSESGSSGSRESSKSRSRESSKSRSRESSESQSDESRKSRRNKHSKSRSREHSKSRSSEHSK
ncbi:hypothetical protein AVEN_251679-1 [Araneus ventricosus]|uniref:Uncharacterized protein n=1 Tax=Araneus ventricosus TaxID=182803 RepID=A0A4Y2HFI7_ARAVE|nr:hypothetical protein AVEN_251679-1 [Araneus ventricosus]